MSLLLQSIVGSEKLRSCRPEYIYLQYRVESLAVQGK